MLPALWVAKTGLSAQDMNLTTISNNLANVSTTGFKRDRAEFQDLLYQTQRQPGAQSTQDSELPSGLQTGTGVRIVGTQKSFTAGSLQTTENPLDMAVDGRGARTNGSWPRSRRWAADRSTEFATPLTSGGNDSVMIATRMPSRSARHACVRRPPTVVSANPGENLCLWCSPSLARASGP